MKKKLMPFLIIFSLIALIVVVMLSLSTQKRMIVTIMNKDKKPITMVSNKYQDAFCGMVIDDLSYSAQVIRDDGKSWFFHDHGDYIEWLKDKPFKDKVTIWVFAKDTKRWIKAKDAYFTMTEETPMGYGFGAYEHKKKGMIDFQTMKLRVLRGETMLNPKYKQLLLKQDTD